MSKNFNAISTKKVNQMTRTLEEKKTVISTLNVELLECRNNFESLNVEFRNNVERLNDQVRDDEKLRSAYESLEKENRKLVESIKTATDALATLQATTSTTTHTEAEVIGKLILDKMKNASHCPMSPKGQSLYMTAMSEVPKASAYALASSIPCIVSAFLADCGKRVN